MQPIVLDMLKKADCISQLTSVVSMASEKPTTEKWAYIDFLTKQHNAQATETNNKAFALATAKRRACQYLGGSEEQWNEMLQLEQEAQEKQPELPKATKIAKPRKRKSKQLELAVA